MSGQLTFDLPSLTARGRDDFFVSEANRLAVAVLDNWEKWPSSKVLVVGAPGSGKSHLASIWADEAGAKTVHARDLDPNEPLSEVGGTVNLVIEDIDRVVADAPREEALFHLHNAVLGQGGYLLMTSSSAAHNLNYSLPDLASRVRGTHVATLEDADDALLSAVLVKLFADRQLEIAPNLVDFLVQRMERSFSGAADLVEKLDKAALSRKRNLTRALAREVLEGTQPGEKNA